MLNCSRALSFTRRLLSGLSVAAISSIPKPFSYFEKCDPSTDENEDDFDGLEQDKEFYFSSENEVAQNSGALSFEDTDELLDQNQLAQESDPSNDAQLMNSIDTIVDDLFHCQPVVLKQFCRLRKISSLQNKAVSVSNLIDLAYEEAVTKSNFFNNTDIKNIRRLIGDKNLKGDSTGNAMRISGIREKWTDKKLETSFLESACARHLKFQNMASRNPALTARQNAKRSEMIMRTLLRPFLSDFNNLCDEAVHGVHRSYRIEVDELLRTNSPVDILSPFCSCLCTGINTAFHPHFLGHVDLTKKMIHKLGLYRSSQADSNGDPIIMLECMMGMLENVSTDAEACRQIWRAQGIGYGVFNHKTFVESLRVFISAKNYYEIEGAPLWVTEMATRFGNWEAVVRNDIKLLANAPPLIFLTILQALSIYYAATKVYEDVISGKELDFGLKNSLREALLQHYQDPEKVSEIILRLNNFVGCETSDGRNIAIGFYKAVDTQLQNMTMQEISNIEKTERVAVILRSMTLFAFQGERCAGLYWLLLRMTIDMQFHLRFAKVFRKLQKRERNYVRSKQRGLNAMLEYFEKDMGITPISMKAACFLSITILALTFKSPMPGRLPKIRRYISVTGRDEFTVVEFTDKGHSLGINELNIALPPQLTYQRWSTRDDINNNVYKNVPSKAIKGAASNIMLLSQAPIMNALDCISRVPWRISRYMLHVQEEILREGYGFGKIRPSFYPLHYTNKKSGEIRHEGQDRSIFNILLTRNYKKQRDFDWRRMSELRSARTHYIQALRQARALVQYSHIYFPHSMDFRGRMYPLPGRLNHTGSDPFRALMEYAEPKPLGKVGLYWMKVHLANKMGFTKLTFNERVQYVDEHITDVINSAEAPLIGDKWWQEGAEPLQALMVCHALSQALKCSQGPENYMSYLPVAVDGSYNGLQHYSAIGRDEYGAKLVNLLPSKRPADAYTGILKEMLKSIERDAAKNMQVAQRCLGTGVGLDRNHIKRKTIKRPIMTQVYGVTGYGMQEQLFQELYRQNFQHGLWTRVDVKEMSSYLREKIFESLGITFKETQECRKWLERITNLIWRCQPCELRCGFSWTTPLGLIVRQPYRTRNAGDFFTASGYSKVSAQTLAPASRKQLTAIAPNIIHSLDATHLAMTALEFDNRGLNMMAVHDSFWTHACDLPVLSQVLREQFVLLYDTYDPLVELKRQWEEQFFFDLRRHAIKLPDPPPRGELDLKQVLKSPYFFS